MTSLSGYIHHLIACNYKYMEKVKFGNKLKSLREEKELTIEKLAEILRIDSQTLEDLEEGNKNIQDLEISFWLLFLEFFNLKHDDIVEETDVFDI